MAAVTKGTLRPVEVPGYEVNDKGQAAAAISKGDLLVMTATTPANGFLVVWDKAPTTGITEAMGVALMDAKVGGVVAVGIQGEMDGFSGLTPGAPLYPSTAVAGGIDTTPIAASTVRMRAVTTTRVRFSFV
jgi:hypothetical protein